MANSIGSLQEAINNQAREQFYALLRETYQLVEQNVILRNLVLNGETPTKLFGWTRQNTIFGHRDGLIQPDCISALTNFDEVREQVIEELIAAETTKLLNKIGFYEQD